MVGRSFACLLSYSAGGSSVKSMILCSSSSCTACTYARGKEPEKKFIFITLQHSFSSSVLTNFLNFRKTGTNIHWPHWIRNNSNFGYIVILNSGKVIKFLFLAYLFGKFGKDEYFLFFVLWYIYGYILSTFKAIRICYSIYRRTKTATEKKIEWK